MRITPKDWGEFQHYKDRDPTWIKLHKRLLDNYEFHSLPIASRALAPMLWLLASEHKDGVIEATEQKMAFRLRMTIGELTDALMPLVQAGFFTVERVDSELLAGGKQVAMPEERTSKTQVEKEISSEADASFQTFYETYPRRESRGAALKAYRAALKKTDAATILAATRAFRTKRAGQDPKFTPLPATWLNAEKWDDEPPRAIVRAPTPTFDATHDDGWRERARIFFIKGMWASNWGPKPDEPDCKCPTEIIEETRKAVAA